MYLLGLVVSALVGGSVGAWAALLVVSRRVWALAGVLTSDEEDGRG